MLPSRGERRESGVHSSPRWTKKTLVQLVNSADLSRLYNAEVRRKSSPEHPSSSPRECESRMGGEVEFGSPTQGISINHDSYWMVRTSRNINPPSAKVGVQNCLVCCACKSTES